jgi:hypothetical protein
MSGLIMFMSGLIIFSSKPLLPSSFVSTSKTVPPSVPPAGGETEQGDSQVSTLISIAARYHTLMPLHLDPTETATQHTANKAMHSNDDLKQGDRAA